MVSEAWVQKTRGWKEIKHRQQWSVVILSGNSPCGITLLLQEVKCGCQFYSNLLKYHTMNYFICDFQLEISVSYRRVYIRRSTCSKWTPHWPMRSSSTSFRDMIHLLNFVEEESCCSRRTSQKTPQRQKLTHHPNLRYLEEVCKGLTIKGYIKLTLGLGVRVFVQVDS